MYRGGICLSRALVCICDYENGSKNMFFIIWDPQDEDGDVNVPLTSQASLSRCPPSTSQELSGMSLSPVIVPSVLQSSDEIVVFKTLERIEDALLKHCYYPRKVSQTTDVLLQKNMKKLEMTTTLSSKVPLNSVHSQGRYLNDTVPKNDKTPGILPYVSKARYPNMMDVNFRRRPGNKTVSSSCLIGLVTFAFKHGKLLEEYALIFENLRKDFPRSLGNNIAGTPFENPDRMASHATGFTIPTIRRCGERMEAVPLCTYRPGSVPTDEELSNLSVTFSDEPWYASSKGRARPMPTIRRRPRKRSLLSLVSTSEAEDPDDEKIVDNVDLEELEENEDGIPMRRRSQRIRNQRRAKLLIRLKGKNHEQKSASLLKSDNGKKGHVGEEGTNLYKGNVGEEVTTLDTTYCGDSMKQLSICTMDADSDRKDRHAPTIKRSRSATKIPISTATSVKEISSFTQIPMCTEDTTVTIVERTDRTVVVDPTPNVMLNSIVDSGEMSVRHPEFENREITLNQKSVDGNTNSTPIESCGNFDIYGQQFPNVYDHQDMSCEWNSAQIFDHVNTYGLYSMDTSSPYQDAEKRPEINEDMFDHFGFRTQYPTWNNSIINDPNNIYTAPVLQESYTGNDYSVEKSNSLMYCAPQYFTSNEVSGLPPLRDSYEIRGLPFVHDSNEIPGLPTVRESDGIPALSFVPDSNEIPGLPSANETLMEVRTSNVPREPIECYKNEMYKRYVVETASENINESASASCSQFEPVVVQSNDEFREDTFAFETPVVEERCSSSCKRSLSNVGDYMCESTKTIIARARFFFHRFYNHLFWYGKIPTGSLDDPDEVTSQATGVSVEIVRECTDLRYPSSIKGISKANESVIERGKLTCDSPLLTPNQSVEVTSDEESLDSTQVPSEGWTLDSTQMRSEEGTLDSALVPSEVHDSTKMPWEEGRLGSIQVPSEGWTLDSTQMRSNEETLDSALVLSEEGLHDSTKMPWEEGTLGSTQVTSEDGILDCTQVLFEEGIHDSTMMPSKVRALALDSTQVTSEDGTVNSMQDLNIDEECSEEVQKEKNLGFERRWSSRIKNQRKVYYGDKPRRKTVSQDLPDTGHSVKNNGEAKIENSGIWERRRRLSERKKRPRRAFSPTDDPRSTKGLLLVGPVCRGLRFVRENQSDQSSSNLLDIVSVELEDGDGGSV
ncbi:unnamed protein product [Angiostrongylus costaricensis]|uniref:SET domain-containing protein n=1 Tax=Angiostrongylus costaricensis TaxID=334426 RepID=A0A158PH43_ANGCS|nr:unnamed protein product [Angiostrongylus costaricensis]